MLYFFLAYFLLLFLLFILDKFYYSVLKFMSSVISTLLVSLFSEPFTSAVFFQFYNFHLVLFDLFLLYSVFFNYFKRIYN